jgi:hypothetical protein
MGAPANQNNTPVVNGLNFNAPRVRATTTQTPAQQSISEILGYKPSKYEGLDMIPNTNYFYGNDNVYEAYDVPPPRYGYKDQFGMIHYADSYGQAGFGGNPNTDASGNFILNPGNARYTIVEPGEVEGTIYRDGQAFKPVDKDVEIPGFTRFEGQLTPSMVDLLSMRSNREVLPTPNVMSFLSAPLPTNTYEGSHGAGRFLNAGNLLPAVDSSNSE